jgi:hypothetical protein
MSKTLAKLLSKSEREISKAIAKLEQSSGYPSEDVRILAEIKQTMRIKINQLGLDPDDTTADELYYGLQSRFDRDSELINRAMGVSARTSLAERLNKAIQLVNHCARVDEVWVVKNSVAKKLLADNPPKHLIKKLHYRSAASLIKREDIAELYLLADKIEPANWIKTTDKQLSKLNTPDYELRAIKIIKLSNSPLLDSDNTLVVDKRLGTVAIRQSDPLEGANVLSLTLLLLTGLHSVNPSGYNEAIHELSPALRWWSDNNYLIADAEKPVSFNLKDVAINYLNGKVSTEATTHYGQQSLWQELHDRYQRVLDSLMEPEMQDEINQATNMPVTSELANEYVTVESE